MIGTSSRRRTTTFKAATMTCIVDGKTAAVNSPGSFRRYDDRSKQEILGHCYLDGKADVPDVARRHRSGDFNARVCSSEETYDLRTQIRMPIWDLREHLFGVKTVNHLLMAFYDALEAHRTHNGLRYPQSAGTESCRLMSDVPLFIEDVMHGVARCVQERRACCFLIDMDNSVPLSRADHPPPLEEPEGHMLEGTPMFTARSACVGSFFVSSASVTAVGMPELTGDALDRYNAVHGPARYEKYPPETIGGAKQHGFTPPPPIDHSEFQSDIQYVHRPEHDVESIFWIMLYVLLLVKPKDGEAAKYASPAFGQIWGPLSSCSISGPALGEEDSRNVIFERRISTWMDAFDGSMRDVGNMLCRIARQIKTEWALWEGSATAPDHLHEAVQRIILQYLVDHREDDVVLLPGQTRPTKERPPRGWSLGPERIHEQSG
ncbi:hypothetical protein V8D89_000040 [Ganoderma adspersum]